MSDPQHPKNGKLRARLRRREKIQRVADLATQRWQLNEGLPSGPSPDADDGPLFRVLSPPHVPGLPKPAEESALPPPRTDLVFKAGILRSLARLFFWLGGALRFGMGVSWDWLQRRNTVENRARRLRKTFESMGTTFIKLGQQLSMRLDLLPYIYTRELEKLLDKLDPFPLADAISAIERVESQKKDGARKPLQDIFAAFDPEPIGRASVACVYHAVLKSGERVAVKVRRPGIGEQLAADMRALGWMLTIAEVLFLSPGFLKHFIFELRTMLMDELDFRHEARFAELYRRRVRKTKQMRFVSVPRVFFEYSSDEVLVSQFVSGIWLKELLPALSSHDAQAMALLDEWNIDPVILARRIQLIARFNNFENIFFHADLHPANILIQRNNKIVLIDFGSCGSFSKRELNAWRRWFDAQSIDDVGGMVQAALAIIEPLPPIDKDELGQRLETEFWKNLYAIKSKHSDWSERISSRLWLGFLELCREFRIPMRLNTLRMIRASMLTDTIAGRLDHDQDPYREFRYYEKGAGKRAKKRVLKRVRAVFGPSKFIRVEQGVESALKLFFQVQRTLDSLSGIRIGAIVAKLSYFLSLFLQHLAWILLTASLSTAVVWLPHLLGFRSNPISLYAAFKSVILNRWWQVIAFTPTLIVLLRTWFRLKEKEYPRGSSAVDDR